MRRTVWALFLVGVCLQLLFVVRVWNAWPSYPDLAGNEIVSDSLEFRGLMERFLRSPGFVPSWKKSGTGTDIPGCLLPLLLGVPAMVTHDIRSSALVVVLFHVLAGAILVTTLGRAFGDRFAAIFLVVFWLSPWRLFHSGFTWEPNLLILPAAVHLWGCWASREVARPFPSLALGATLVLTFQLHLSALFLLLLTGLLLVRRNLKVSWAWFFAGLAAGSLPLIPAVVAYGQGRPLHLLSDMGFPGRGFSYVLPVLRALQLWLRLGSLDVGRMYASDCVSCAREALGGGPADTLLCLAYRLSGVIASASVVVSLAAGWWWWRRSREAKIPAAERWLAVYSWSSLGALLLAAGLAPITLQTWHVVIAAPAACLPVAAWIGSGGPFRTRWVRVFVVLFLLARLPLAFLLAFDYAAFCRVPADVARTIKD